MKGKIIVYQGKSYIIHSETNRNIRLMRLMLKIEYLIVPKGTKLMGLGKLGLNA